MVSVMNHQNSTWNRPDFFIDTDITIILQKEPSSSSFTGIVWPFFLCPIVHCYISHTDVFLYYFLCDWWRLSYLHICLSSIIYLWNILYIWHQMWLCSQALLDQSEFSRMYLSMYQDMYLYPTHTVCLDDYLGLWNELHSYKWPSM